MRYEALSDQQVALLRASGVREEQVAQMNAIAQQALQLRQQLAEAVRLLADLLDEVRWLNATLPPGTRIRRLDAARTFLARADVAPLLDKEGEA